MQMRGLFSPDYNEYLQKRDNIRSLVVRAREELRGCTLYGEPVDLSNPEEMVAALYVMYKDYELFHERI